MQYMSIDHRRFDVIIAKQRMYRSDIITVFGQMSIKLTCIFNASKRTHNNFDGVSEMRD